MTEKIVAILFLFALICVCFGCRQSLNDNSTSSAGEPAASAGEKSESTPDESTPDKSVETAKLNPRIESELESRLLGYWIRYGSSKDYIRFLPGQKIETGIMEEEVGLIGLKTFGIQISKENSGTWQHGDDWIEFLFDNKKDRHDYRFKQLLFLDGKMYRRVAVEDILKEIKEEKAYIKTLKQAEQPHGNRDKISGFWYRDLGNTYGMRIRVYFIFKQDGSYQQVTSGTVRGNTRYQNLVEAKWMVDEKKIFVEFPKYFWDIPYKFDGDELRCEFALSDGEFETMHKGSAQELARIESLIMDDAISPF